MQRSFGEAEAEGSKDFELRGLCRFVGRKGFLAMHVCNCSVHLLDFGCMQGFLGFLKRELLQQFWPFVPVCLFCQGLRSESVELAFVLPGPQILQSD